MVACLTCFSGGFGNDVRVRDSARHYDRLEVQTFVGRATCSDVLTVCWAGVSDRFHIRYWFITGVIIPLVDFLDLNLVLGWEIAK